MSFCIRVSCSEFATLNLPLSPLSFLYEPQIVPVKSLSFKSLIKYDIVQQQNVLSAQKQNFPLMSLHSFQQPGFYSFNRLHDYSVALQFLKSKLLVLLFYICDTNTMTFLNQIYNSFKPPPLLNKNHLQFISIQISII